MNQEEILNEHEKAILYMLQSHINVKSQKF